MTTAAALAVPGPTTLLAPASAEVPDTLVRLAYYRGVGEQFLAKVFGACWQRRVPELHDAIAQTPINDKWVRKRFKKLEPWVDGAPRLLPERIWNLSCGLMQPGDEWLDLWRECALRTPQDWLLLVCGVAMCRPDGSLRPLNRRAKSMLVAGVLAWQLAEYDPEGDPDCPYVIRGLPYGAWEWLLAYWELRAEGYTRCPASRSAVYGTHRAGGDGRSGECGYITHWKRVGIAYSVQPPWWAVEPDLRGKGRWLTVERERDGKIVKERVWQCWAFHELRLRIGGAGLTAHGPPQPWWLSRPRKPPANDWVEYEDLTTDVEAAECDWFPIEAPPAQASTPPQLLAANPPPSAALGIAPGGDECVPQGDATATAGFTPRAEPRAGVWLALPAASSAPLIEDTDGDCPRPLPIVLRPAAELELPSGRDRSPTLYGAGKLYVMRADESKPMSARLRTSLERFERAARLRDRGPPDPPPE